MSKAKWYCGGYGGLHLGIKGGRHWFVCQKCRWNPNYRDSAEVKAQFQPKEQAK